MVLSRARKNPRCWRSRVLVLLQFCSRRASRNSHKTLSWSRCRTFAALSCKSFVIDLASQKNPVRFVQVFLLRARQQFPSILFMCDLTLFRILKICPADSLIVPPPRPRGFECCTVGWCTVWLYYLALDVLWERNLLNSSLFRQYMTKHIMQWSPPQNRLFLQRSHLALIYYSVLQLKILICIFLCFFMCISGIFNCGGFKFFHIL